MRNFIINFLLATTSFHKKVKYKNGCFYIKDKWRISIGKVKFKSINKIFLSEVVFEKTTSGSIIYCKGIMILISSRLKFNISLNSLDFHSKNKSITVKKSEIPKQNEDTFYGNLLNSFSTLLFKLIYDRNILLIRRVVSVEVARLLITNQDLSIAMQTLRCKFSFAAKGMDCSFNCSLLSFRYNDFSKGSVKIFDSSLIVDFVRHFREFIIKSKSSIPRGISTVNWVSPSTVRWNKIDLCLSGMIGNNYFEFGEGSHFSIASIVFNWQMRFCQNKLMLKCWSKTLSVENLMSMFSNLLSASALRWVSVSGLYWEIAFEFNVLNVLHNVFDLKVTHDSVNIDNNFTSAFPRYVLQEKRCYSFKSDGSLFPNVNHERGIANISQKFLKILLLTEDPNFYEHNGIDVRLMGNCTLINLAKKGFYRGGSTITMQLVRNLYLNSEKNLYRKIDEIALTILIENVLKINKINILEVYLNVIEFGLDIYGIFDACEYYFSKRPIDLSFEECIVLTYVIPRPKYFVEALLGGSQQLNKNLKRHIRFYADKLVEHKVVTADERNKFSRSIYFSLGGKKVVFNYD